MTVERNYKSEARSARMAARAKLQAYREARRQARGGGVTAKPAAASEHPTRQGRSVSQISPDAFFEIAGTPEGGGEVSEPVDEVSSEWTSELGPAVCADDDQGIEPTSSETEANAIPAPSEPEPAIPDPEPHTPETGQPATGDPVEPNAPPMDASQPDVTADPNSDLFELPGAGAGMIWMFQKCGIHSLAELSKADPDTLSAQLGVVGHILNIEPWIEYARERERPLGTNAALG